MSRGTTAYFYITDSREQMSVKNELTEGYSPSEQHRLVSGVGEKDDMSTISRATHQRVFLVPRSVWLVELQQTKSNLSNSRYTQV